ncbi:MAG: DegT/DnrJ/EryC1/StrS family aminotransferase [Gammaproteobacteria bacterium]
MIPMVDLKPQYQALKEEIDAGILRALADAQFILGPNVTAFEQEAAAYLGVAHAVACASGTDALHLALRAAGIGPGDEVITSAFTFIATAEAIRYVSARPVFTDIDPLTFNIDPRSVEALITPATRAVLPVHLFGMPADLGRLMPLCEQHKLTLIEDCAQSFGASIAGRQTGSFGASGAFSFFPSKNLGCYGDGGLISTDSDELAAQFRMLRNHGSKVRYHHDVIGYNSRLDELQAVVLRAKLKRIDRYNDQRRQVARWYTELLEGAVQTPLETENARHVYHQYTLLSPHRDRIMSRLQAAGIASAIYYPIPLHRQVAFTGQYRAQELPVTERVSAQCLSLPMYPELEEPAVRAIVNEVKEALVG